MNTNMTTSSGHHPILVSGFMLSGVFCFAVAVIFLVSNISGHDVNQPFSVLTTLLCR